MRAARAVWVGDRVQSGERGEAVEVGELTASHGDVDHAAGSCGGADAADDVYSVELTPGRWEVSVQVDVPFQPIVYARRYCTQDGQWSELACNSRINYQEGTAWLDLEIDATQSVFIFVDAMSHFEMDRPRDYQLRVRQVD